MATEMFAFGLGSLVTIVIWVITSSFARRLTALHGRGGGQIEVDDQVYLFTRDELSQIAALIPRQTRQRLNASAGSVAYPF